MLVAGRKVAGVLAEIAEGAVVLGVGLNVNQEAADLPADARLPAASLRTVDGAVRDRAPLLAALVRALEAEYGLWSARGIAALHERLAARDFLRGRSVLVAGEAGRGVGIDKSGRLEVEIAGARRVVESGEIVVVG